MNNKLTPKEYFTNIQKLKLSFGNIPEYINQEQDIDWVSKSDITQVFTGTRIPLYTILRSKNIKLILPTQNFDDIIYDLYRLTLPDNYDSHLITTNLTIVLEYYTKMATNKYAEQTMVLDNVAMFVVILKTLMMTPMTIQNFLICFDMKDNGNLQAMLLKHGINLDQIKLTLISNKIMTFETYTKLHAEMNTKLTLSDVSSPYIFKGDIIYRTYNLPTEEEYVLMYLSVKKYNTEIKSPLCTELFECDNPGIKSGLTEHFVEHNLTFIHDNLDIIDMDTYCTIVLDELTNFDYKLYKYFINLDREIYTNLITKLTEQNQTDLLMLFLELFVDKTTKVMTNTL